MLHSLPALLNELEKRLIAGEDPIPLLATVRWQEITGWPTNRQDALRMQQRLKNLSLLVTSLEAPLRSILMKMAPNTPYGPQGRVPLPSTLSVRLHQSV
jgi:hypothetical protein